MGITAMPDNQLKKQVFKLKGRLYTLTVISLLEVHPDLLASQLEALVEKAPRLFQNTPIVLDCSAVQEKEIHLSALCQTIRQHGLVPIAIQGGHPKIETLAQCEGLAILNASSNYDKLIDPPTGEPSPSSESKQTRLLTSPVRSGQQILSSGDLVILSSVSHGSELLAEGHIHIYGPLRGRALAGISGNKESRIFCQSLEAELVAIAGYYRLSDAIESPSGPCQIYLQDDHIQIEPL